MESTSRGPSKSSLVDPEEYPESCSLQLTSAWAGRTLLLEVGDVYETTDLRIRRNFSPAGVKTMDSPPLRISPAAIRRGRSASDALCFSMISIAACNGIFEAPYINSIRGTDLVTTDNHHLLECRADGDQRAVFINPAGYSEESPGCGRVCPRMLEIGGDGGKGRPLLDLRRNSLIRRSVGRTDVRRYACGKADETH